MKYAGELGLTWPQISDNGAMIIDPVSSENLWSAPLGEELSRIAMRPIIESRCEFFATHAGGAITDMAKLDTWDLTRVSALDLDTEAADAMMESMSDESGLDMVKVWLPYNQLWAVDFTRSGVNKGRALRVLCEMIGITPSQTIAVGDSFNDAPLMKTAGLGDSDGQRAAGCARRCGLPRPDGRGRRPRARDRAAYSAADLNARLPSLFDRRKSGSGSAKSEDYAERVFQKTLNLVDEERAFGAIYNAVVGGQGGGHHLTDNDAVVGCHDRTLLNRANGEYRGLRRLDYGDKAGDVHHAHVGHGKRAAGILLRAQSSLIRAGGQILGRPALSRSRTSGPRRRQRAL